MLSSYSLLHRVHIFRPKSQGVSKRNESKYLAAGDDGQTTLMSTPDKLKLDESLMRQVNVMHVHTYVIGHHKLIISVSLNTVHTVCCFVEVPGNRSNPGLQCVVRPL